jgi:hypothetical protein
MMSHFKWTDLKNLHVLDERYEKTATGFAVIRVVEHYGAFPMRYRLDDHTVEPHWQEEIPCEAVECKYRGSMVWVTPLLDMLGKGPRRLYFCRECKKYKTQGSCHSIKLNEAGEVDWGENGVYTTCCSGGHNEKHFPVVEVRSTSLKIFQYETEAQMDSYVRRDMWYRDRIMLLEAALPMGNLADIDKECELRAQARWARESEADAERRKNA